MTTPAPTSTKKNPVPVRLDEPEDKLVSDLNEKTGLVKSEILRRACRFALPKFLSGEVDIATVVPAKQQ